MAREKERVIGIMRERDRIETKTKIERYRDRERGIERGRERGRERRKNREKERKRA